MGYDVDLNIRGTYFGYTRAQYPYYIADAPPPKKNPQCLQQNRMSLMRRIRCLKKYPGALFDITIEVSIENSTEVPLTRLL